MGNPHVLNDTNCMHGIRTIKRGSDRSERVSLSDPVLEQMTRHLITTFLRIRPLHCIHRRSCFQNKRFPMKGRLIRYRAVSKHKLASRLPRRQSLHKFIFDSSHRKHLSWHRLSVHQCVPGTKIKRTFSATAAMPSINIAIDALVRSSFLTKGSLTRDQFIHVYSLNPRYAATMSILYW